MYDIGGLELDDLPNGAQILAYGDFDNNKFTDIVTLDDNSRALTVYLYSHDTFAFSPLTTLEFQQNVAAVIPGDYNYDGNLDLLVVTQSPGTANPETYLKFFFRNKASPFFGEDDDKPNLEYTLKGFTQPFVFDIDGDRNLDIMIIENKIRKVLYVRGSKLEKKDFSGYISTAAGCKPFSQVSTYPFSNPHSNSFIDFNGDCAADLFLTSLDPNNKVNFEIYLRNPADSKFCLVEVAKIDHPISVVSFGDVNNDGRPDLIYATQPSSLQKSMGINIVYNNFAFDPLSPCTLKKANMTSPFNVSGYNAEETNDGINQFVPLPNDIYSAGTRLYSPDKINRPSKIRVGDINIDGFADLLFVVNDPVKEEPGFGSIVLAVNQGGLITFKNSGVIQDDQPYQAIIGDEKTTALSEIPAQFASFYDFDEWGRMGLWIVVKGKDDPKTTLLAAFNYVNTENFILKTLGLNGYYVKGSDDITVSLGGLYYGSTVECKVSDTNGKNKLAKGTQMPSSAYTPLDLPYIFIGLGRTNNYVENFVMGITTKNGNSDLQKQLWTPIIPNSQLIVNTVRNGAWTLDVYVNPTSETMLIVMTTLVILLVIGGVVVFLHMREKEEDLKDRDPLIHVFG